MSNKFTDNMSKKAGDAAVNIRRSVKCYALAADIRKELDGGADLKNILQERVQCLDEAAAEADAERLVDGIRSFNTAKEVEVDTEWVRRQLNSALSSLDNKERVLYLSNVIFAVTAAFPNVKVDEETRDRINSMAAAEENSDEDVSDLTGVVNDVLPEVGTLLQKATTGSVTKRLHKVNSEQLLEIIGAGENFVTAYAAARYVQVRTGVYGFDHSDASAFTVGAASASGVESSKLVHMYFSGKITLEVLAERLRSIYTAAATVISAHAVRLMSRTAFAALGGSAVLFGFLFLLLGLRVDLFVALFASGAIASLFFGEVITVERVEAGRMGRREECLVGGRGVLEPPPGPRRIRCGGIFRRRRGRGRG